MHRARSALSQSSACLRCQVFRIAQPMGRLAQLPRAGRGDLWYAQDRNLQPRGSHAKAYQVKQVRGVIVSQGLAREPEDEPDPGGPTSEDAGSSRAEESAE